MNRIPFLRLTALASGLALYVLLGCASAAAQRGEACRHATGVPLPTAGNTGYWSGNVLTLVDRTAGLMRYNLNGQLLGQLDTREVPGLQAYTPRAVGDSDMGPVLQTTEGNFAILNQDLKPMAMYGLDRDQALAEQGPAGRAYSWLVDSDHMVFCGAVRHGSDWKVAYYRAPLDDMASAVPIDREREPNQDAELNYCRTGYRFHATGRDGWVYLLLGDTGVGQEDSTRIHAFQFDGDEIVNSKIFDLDFGSRAKIDNWRNEQEFVDAMAAIEGADHAPLGLYASASGEWLYVLAKSRTERGVVWTLQAVDADKGLLRGSAVLPSTNGHLTVIPGPRYWAFFERDAVRGFLNHAPAGLAFVPTERIEEIGEAGSTGRPICDG